MKWEYLCVVALASGGTFETRRLPYFSSEPSAESPKDLKLDRATSVRRSADLNSLWAELSKTPEKTVVYTSANPTFALFDAVGKHKLVYNFTIGQQQTLDFVGATKVAPLVLYHCVPEDVFNKFQKSAPLAIDFVAKTTKMKKAASNDNNEDEMKKKESYLEDIGNRLEQHVLSIPSTVKWNWNPSK